MLDTSNLSHLTIWWAFCGSLVLIMQGGFILFESGCVPKRHRSGIAVKNFIMLLTSLLGFTMVGYLLQYGETRFGGFVGWLDIDESVSRFGSSWQFCQTGYAIIAATIISGAIAGRSRLRANVFAGLAVSTIVYPIVAHWIWGTGFLGTPTPSTHEWLDYLTLGLWPEKWYVHDFAGSGAVHYVGGIAALVGAWAVGPRIELSPFRRGLRLVLRDTGPESRRAGDTPLLFNQKDSQDARQGSEDEPDMGLVSYGLVLLMLGWMGFNGGAVRFQDDNSDVGQFFLLTCCAAGGGMLLGLVKGMPGAIDSRLFKFEPLNLMAGSMGGMVAVTANCDIISRPIWAVCLGGIAGVMVWAISVSIRFLGIDDPVDAVAVHAGGGVVGLLAAPVILHDSNLLFGQILYLVSSGAFTVFAMLIVFGALDAMGSQQKGDAYRVGWLRCHPQYEKHGLRFNRYPGKMMRRPVVGRKPTRSIGYPKDSQKIALFIPRYVFDVIVWAVTGASKFSSVRRKKRAKKSSKHSSHPKKS